MSNETKTPEQKKAETEAKKKEVAEKKAAELQAKEDAKAKKLQEAAEKEAARKAAAPKSVVLPVNRDNLTMIGPGLFIFIADKALEDCEKEGAFKCVNAKSFGIRKGDIVLCRDDEKVVTVVVQ